MRTTMDPVFKRQDVDHKQNLQGWKNRSYQEQEKAEEFGDITLRSRQSSRLC